MTLEQQSVDERITRIESKRLDELAREERRPTLPMRAYDLLETDIPWLIGQLRSARKDSERLRASLRWALEDMEDGRPDEAPVHYCEFTVNPERGACTFHERWAEARRLLDVADIEAELNSGSVLPELERPNDQA